MPMNASGSIFATVALAAALSLQASYAAAQIPAYKAPRTADGKPNLSGIWQAMNAANWDIQGHAAAPGPLPQLGAVGAIPPGLGIVVGDDIPYLPEAAAKKKENSANRLTLDPEVKCFLPGVPRATYMPYPFQIIQGTDTIMFSYEFADAVRLVNMKNAGSAPADSWMGWSAGHWDGNTLVVDVTSQNDQTWFDRAGDFHSDALHVVERYTPVDANILMYEATLEDPKVFSRPWKISMPLYRHIEKNAQLMEFKCIPFSEDVLYGDAGKQ